MITNREPCASRGARTVREGVGTAGLPHTMARQSTCNTARSNAMDSRTSTPGLPSSGKRSRPSSWPRRAPATVPARDLRDSSTSRNLLRCSRRLRTSRLPISFTCPRPKPAMKPLPSSPPPTSRRWCRRCRNAPRRCTPETSIPRRTTCSKSPATGASWVWTSG